MMHSGRAAARLYTSIKRSRILLSLESALRVCRMPDQTLECNRHWLPRTVHPKEVTSLGYHSVFPARAIANHRCSQPTLER